MDLNQLQTLVSSSLEALNMRRSLVQNHETVLRQSKENVVSDIRQATTSCINRVEAMRDELLKDITKLYTRQMKHYSLFDKAVESAQEQLQTTYSNALSQSVSPEDTAVAVKKIVCGLSDPEGREFIFIPEWEDIGKSDIGIIEYKCTDKKENVSHSGRTAGRVSSSLKLNTLQHGFSSGACTPSVLSAVPTPRTRSPCRDTMSILNELNKMHSQNTNPCAIKPGSDGDTCIESQKKDDSDNDSDDIDMLASAAKAWREHLSKETSPIKPLMSIKLTTEEPASELSHVMKSLENLKIKFEPTARMGDTSVSEPDFSNPCLTSSAVCDQSLCTTVESVKSEHFEPSERTSQSSATKSMKSPLTNILNGPNLRDRFMASRIHLFGMPSVELKFPIGVCKFAGGLIVCNSGCNTAIVFKYSEDGVVFDMAEITCQFVRPSAAVVDKSGEYLFIKDDKAIFKFDRDLNLILDFCEGFNDRPYGLSVSDDNMLVTMTGCGNGRYTPRRPSIVKYDMMGNLIQTLPLHLPLVNQSKLRFMDTTAGLIYISDLGASRVFAADLNTGALVQVIASNGRGPGQFCEPSGITCDSDGNFLVADSKSNRIQVFDKRGQFRCILECQGGLVRPSGIYLDGDELFVVNYLKHQVMVYKLEG